MKKIKIYTAPNCPYCKMLKEDLNSCGVPYEEMSAGDPEARKEMISKGIKAVPVVEVDGKRTEGYNPEWVKKNLCKI
jgi:glutaredoxin